MSLRRLFANLNDKQLPVCWRKLFELMAWIAIVAASYLLIYRLVRDGAL